MAYGPEYRLTLMTDSGSRLINDVQPFAFSATRKVNTISPCSITLKPEFARRMFTVADPKEYLFLVEYKPPGGTMSAFNVYFMDDYEWRI